MGTRMRDVGCTKGIICLTELHVYTAEVGVPEKNMYIWVMRIASFGREIWDCI